MENLVDSCNTNHTDGIQVCKFVEMKYKINFFQLIFVAAIALNRRITYNNKEYPDWAVSLGWTSCLLSILLIPFYMGYRLLYMHEGDLFEVCTDHSAFIRK